MKSEEEKNKNRIKSIERDLKIQLQKLTDRIVLRTQEIRKFSRLLVETTGAANGMWNNYREGAKRSLMATRKKARLIEAKIKSLSKS